MMDAFKFNFADGMDTVTWHETYSYRLKDAFAKTIAAVDFF